MDAWQIIKKQIVDLMKNGGAPLSEEQESLLAGYLCFINSNLDLPIVPLKER